MIGDLFDSPWKILIVAVVLIVLFGSKKLPDAARSLGKSMRILKTEVKDLREDDDEPKPVPAITAPATAQPQPSAAQPQPSVDELQQQIRDLQAKAATTDAAKVGAPVTETQRTQAS
jgi:sec-independent protein translocase protein TatA